MSSATRVQRSSEMTPTVPNGKVAAVRDLSADAWVETYASGTLRHAKALGLRWKSQYIEERTAFEFGWEFMCVPASRVTFGDVKAEGDCHAITELVWHTRRMQALHPFDGDVFEPKYFYLTEEGDVTTEGVGIWVKVTSAPWVPEGHMVFAFTAVYDKKTKDFLEPVNPC